MSKKENTNLRDNLPSIAHRDLGKRLYMADIDCVLYTYDENGKCKIVGLLDWKNPAAKEIDTWSSSDAYMAIAHQMKVPLWYCITFLDPDKFAVPMYYLIGVDPLAKKSIWHHIWLSEYEYSLFEHQLRDLSIDHNELKNLCRQKRVYTLPPKMNIK